MENVINIEEIWMDHIRQDRRAFFEQFTAKKFQGLTTQLSKLQNEKKEGF
jgi:hypothetical protein